MNRRDFILTSGGVMAGFVAGASALRAGEPPSRVQLENHTPQHWDFPRPPKEIVLPLRRRDPKAGEVQLSSEHVAPSQIGIVVIDMWNYHWCKTCSARLTAMVPRVNRALEAARKLGCQVIFAPTDCVPFYKDAPQRKAVLELPDFPPPSSRKPIEMSGCPVGGDPCGPGMECMLNYGESSIHPDLQIAKNDFISDGPAELFKICKARGLTHLIYAGIATNICVMGKPEAIRTMLMYGLNCYLARDLTDAFGHPPQQAQDVSVAHIEKYACPSIDVIDTLKENGFWNDRWQVEPVLISPWGKTDRPYFFEKSATVHVELPRLKNVCIRYTLDNTEPTASSAIYEKPILLEATASLRAMAFRDDQAIGLPSSAYYVKLPPAPPMPSVRLFDLPPVKEDTGWDQNERRIPARMYNMRIRGKDYRKGLCVHAPSKMTFKIKPEYERFVALAGIDDSVLALNAGRYVGAFPSVTFEVHIDSKLIVRSPVMRVSEGPWRFDVPIPKGSKTIQLIVTDAGDGSRLDVADWCNSGFLISEYKGWPLSP
jgi:nicotinamidase-related amidase